MRYVLTVLLLCWFWVSTVNAQLDRTREVDSLNNRVRELLNARLIDQAEVLAKHALALSNEINYKVGVGVTETNIGLISKQRDKIPEALVHFYRAIEIFKQNGYKKGIARVSTELGFISNEQGDRNKARAYFNTCLEIGREIHDTVAIGASFINLGTIYTYEGNIAAMLVQNEQAAEMFRAIRDTFRLSIAMTNIGGAYFEMKRYSDALKVYKDCIHLNTVVDMPDRFADGLVNMGDTYFVLDRYDSALICFEKALEVYKALNNKSGFVGVYNSLFRLDSAQNNWKSALNNFKLSRLYADSLTAITSNDAIVQAQMSYEYNKKEELAESERKQQLLIRNSSIVGVVLLLAFSIVVYRQRNRVKNEKSISDGLLLNILPPETARELKETGTSVARQYDAVTVLFTDFVNFTGIAQQMSPTDLVAEVHKQFAAFDRIVEKHGLEKIKTIGDAYLAVCGLPQETTDHAYRTVLAALDIVEFVSNNSGVFNIRVGVHSGPVVAGIVGVKKFAYDIWGDTVNTASRMEHACEPGRVNISESTYHLVKEQIECEHRGKVAVKGKGEIFMFYALGLKLKV